MEEERSDTNTNPSDRTALPEKEVTGIMPALPTDRIHSTKNEENDESCNQKEYQFPVGNGYKTPRCRI